MSGGRFPRARRWPGRASCGRRSCRRDRSRERSDSRVYCALCRRYCVRCGRCPLRYGWCRMRCGRVRMRCGRYCVRCGSVLRGLRGWWCATSWCSGVCCRDTCGYIRKGGQRT